MEVFVWVKADKMGPPKNTASSEGLFMLYGVPLLQFLGICMRRKRAILASSGAFPCRSSLLNLFGILRRFFMSLAIGAKAVE